MRKILLLLLLSLSWSSYGQWTTLNIPSSGRHDDVFFINDSVGWAAGGPTWKIYKTTNGGQTWTNPFTANRKYLRSIIFATPTLGFCGSLDSSLFKTTDGGQTWTDIAATISPKPPGICGMAAPTSTVIYGVGIWSSPAYVIKSSDGGNTWTNINLSALATNLVDIHFISADTGFVAGTANPATDGGIILYTTNGGATWSVKHKTLIPQDYIWKIQSPDGIHFFGSVYGLPASGNVRIIKSADKGMTWTTQIVRNTYSYIQTIGFLNPLKGWTGGNANLFETSDAGISWQNVSVGTGYNRFLKLNDSTAFLSGNHIYKYRSGTITGLSYNEPYDELHTLNVSPNPSQKSIAIKLNLKNRSHCKLQLFAADGKLLQTINDKPLEKGTATFSASIQHYPPQTFYLTLRTNEGLIYRRIVKQ